MRHLKPACSLALLFVVAAPAAADHVFGIKGSVIGTDSGTHKVTIAVTQYVNDYAGPTDTFGNSSLSVYPHGIQWGDGDYVYEGTLDYVGPGPSGTAKYSRQFMHTYPDGSLRIVQLGSDCCANSGFFTGNAPSPRGPGDPGVLTDKFKVSFPAPVPVLPNYGYPLLLLALLLAGSGTLLMRS